MKTISREEAVKLLPPEARTRLKDDFTDPVFSVDVEGRVWVEDSVPSDAVTWVEGRGWVETVV